MKCEDIAGAASLAVPLLLLLMRVSYQ